MCVLILIFDITLNLLYNCILDLFLQILTWVTLIGNLEVFVSHNFDRQNCICTFPWKYQTTRIQSTLTLLIKDHTSNSHVNLAIFYQVSGIPFTPRLVNRRRRHHLWCYLKVNGLGCSSFHWFNMICMDQTHDMHQNINNCTVSLHPPPFTSINSSHKSQCRPWSTFWCGENPCRNTNQSGWPVGMIPTLVRTQGTNYHAYTWHYGRPRLCIILTWQTHAMHNLDTHCFLISRWNHNPHYAQSWNGRPRLCTILTW